MFQTTTTPPAKPRQDLTLWAQSTSMRLALFLPSVGWRVHYVLISPSMIATVISACASSILYVLWGPLVKPLMDGWLAEAAGELIAAAGNSTGTEL